MIPNGAIQKRLITHPPRRQLGRPRPIPMQPAPTRWHCNAEDGPASSRRRPVREGWRRGGRAMKFGIFYELQLPRPWEPGGELRLYQNALDQVELADRLGYDYAWEVEHHFLEEYSHSPAPEVFFGAVSQRTKNIRIAHGVRLLPFNFNHPIKVAEQAAVLDIMSNGRVDIGTGRSTTAQELDGFGVNYDRTRDEVKEALEIIVK